MLNCKHVNTPMDPNFKLVLRQRDSLQDLRRYQRLVGRLNYLAITQPYISFLMSVVSQFLQSSCETLGCYDSYPLLYQRI